MTDAPGARSAVWQRPLRRSPPEQAQATWKWRDNIRRGGSGTSQSERTTGNPGGSHRPLPAPQMPESAIQGPFVRTYSWRWPGCLCGREQSRQEPQGSCADSWRRIIILNPYAHDGCNRPGERTALADGL